MSSQIELQLSEFDMIMAMFPEVDAVKYDAEHLRLMREAVIGQPFSSFQYSVSPRPGKDDLTLTVELPSLYPTEEKAKLYVSSNSLSRESQVSINADLLRHLDSLWDGELQVGYAISWLQENSEKFFPIPETKMEEKTENWCMLRLWIYSHHIFSKTKRKDMKKYAEDFEISGFVLPGKPGIICVEGLFKNVTDWWHVVRSWCWQRISCVHEEKENFTEADLAQNFYRFNGFKELSPVEIKAKTTKTFDMKAFQAYLEENSSGYMFMKLFDL